MKIGVIAPTAVPYVAGGAERFHAGLSAALSEAGHEVEHVQVGVVESNLREVVDAYASMSVLDVSRFDMVITGKYPAWMIDHPNHVVHMLHALRGLYDTYHMFLQPYDEEHRERELIDLLALVRSASTRAQLPEVFEGCRRAMDRLGPDHPAFRFPGPLARTIVHALDAIGLGRDSVRRWFAISNTVACRRSYFPPGVPVQVLYPPSDLQGLGPRRYEGLFTSSRLDPPKRVDLLVEAMRYVGTDIELRIAGTGPDERRLHELAGNDPRIRFLGHVPTDELVTGYAEALAVPFIPYDEDLGLVAWEAMMSGKPVITCDDSGGVAELVAAGVTGLVVPPTPASIGKAIEMLSSNPDLARRMGRSGRVRAGGITWERVVRGLLAPNRSRPASSRRAGERPKAVVLSTYPIWPPRAGGQLRCAHLYSGLARSFDLEVVCLTTAGPDIAREEISPGIKQVSVRKSAEHRRVEIEMSDLAGIPVEDIMAAELSRSTPGFGDVVHEALSTASMVIHAHPYLVPLTRGLGVPAVYDAIDAEFALKGSLLQGPDGERFRRAVESLEDEAWKGATLVTGTSSDELEALQARYGPTSSELIVVPNGVDVRAVRYTPSDRRRALRDRWLARSGAPADHVATFIGSWHPPNLDAADHVIEQATKHPRVAFLLAGAHSEHYRDKRVPRNVYLLGKISDAAKSAVLAMADVGLNPMARGTGTNLKVIEYFAAGLPVVSTPKGIRGLDVEPDEHVVVAPLEEFGSSMQELFSGSLACELMTVAARRLAETRYDWERLSARFARAVSSVAGRS